MNALLLYPEFPDTFWSFKHAMKFINKKAANPPLGLITIASMLPADWNLKLIDLNVSTLTENNLEWSDIVLISAMTIQRDSATRLIDRCKNMGKMIIAGGPLFTSEYENFPKIDHLILNEAENTLPLFLDDYSKNRAKRIYQTNNYPDLISTPIPRYDLLELNKYDAMSIQFSRGCPYNCDFCNVTALLGHTPRLKSTNQILEELDSLFNSGWRRNIFFVDDNFIGNKRILKYELLPALIRWRKDKKGCQFITEASINLADDPDLMDLMAKAGFISVFIGIETPSEEGLSECHKTQNTRRDLISSVHTIQNHGIQVMAGFIVGFDTDQPSIFQQQFNFIQESGIITAMVGLLQAPYGTQLFQKLQTEGRIIDGMSGDNADGNTNIVTMLDPVLLKNGYRKLMRDLYSPEPFYRRIRTFLAIYNPQKSDVTISFTEISALLKTIWFMGITGPDRVEYWKLIIWVLTRMPNKFPMAITLTVYGYHFRQVAKLHLNHDEQINPVKVRVKSQSTQKRFSNAATG